MSKFRTHAAVEQLAWAWSRAAQANSIYSWCCNAPAATWIYASSCFVPTPALLSLCATACSVVCASLCSLPAGLLF